MTPETKARQHIDQKLEQAGWLNTDARDFRQLPETVKPRKYAALLGFF